MNEASEDALTNMLRMIRLGQHDRQGGQPSSPGNVSPDEARVAVRPAVTLVSWFDDALVARGMS